MIISDVKRKLLVSLSLLLLFGGCASSDLKGEPVTEGGNPSDSNDMELVGKPESQENETERHAFIMEDGLTFLADIPRDWRYVLRPVYEYTYYRNLVMAGEGYQEDDCSIRFLGSGVWDGEDDFFTITARKGKKEFEYDFPVATESFVFADGTRGEWSYQTGEVGLKYIEAEKTYYEGIVWDLEGKYNIYLSFLKEDYDANEQKITDFLESSCFRENDLGVSGEADFLKRELLTLHIWNRYMNLSVRLPEGVTFAKSEFKNGEDYRTWAYHICLDQERGVWIALQSDQGGGIQEPTGDYDYYLNTGDFKETVYEIPGNGRNYYFPNYNLWVKTQNEEGSEEVWGYLKGIVQSISVGW